MRLYKNREIKVLSLSLSFSFSLRNTKKIAAIAARKMGLHQELDHQHVNLNLSSLENCDE
jgi:hypothetical protein